MLSPARDHDHYEALAAELVRALRGKRSQNGFSRRLGYRSNVVHRWEQGTCWPTAVRFLECCERLGIDVGHSYVHMFKRPPSWLGEQAPASSGALAAFLRELRGGTPIGDLAAAAGINRFTVSRWLKGTAVPNLPQLLHIVDTASGRLPDYISAFVDPRCLPSLERTWRRLTLLRRLAYDEPWSHAVLRALQLDSHPRGCDADTVARKLGLERSEVVRLLEILQEAGQVTREGRRYRADPVRRVDTGEDTERAPALKASWARAAAARLEAGAQGLFGYTLFEASRADLERIRVLQLECARAVQAIIKESTQTDCVGLYCVQLLDLGQ